MPLVVILPLFLWLLIRMFPAIADSAEPVITLLSRPETIYAGLGLLAVLAALMRQWSWFYWLGFITVLVLSVQQVLAGALTVQAEVALRLVWPLLIIIAAALLSVGRKPPLWTPAGLILFTVVSLSPWLALQLPLTTIAQWTVTGWLDGPSLSSQFNLSLAMSILLGVVLLGWLVHLWRRPAQPRQWGEWALAMILIMALATTSAPQSMVLAFVAATLIMLIALTLQMLNLAYVDELTQLPGRRALSSDMRKLGRKSAVTMLDVDHFKKFNDTYGHEVGDQVLRLLGALLRKEPGLRAYRYGGEEFTLLFNHADTALIAERLEQVRQRVASYPLKIRSGRRPKTGTRGKKGRGRSGGGKSVRVTISLGCAIRQPGEAPDLLIKRADGLLYRAKKAGRNRVVIAT